MYVPNTDGPYLYKERVFIVNTIVKTRNWYTIRDTIHELYLIQYLKSVLDYVIHNNDRNVYSFHSESPQLIERVPVIEYLPSRLRT